MAFNDFRDPIEYVVNQYFEKKRFLKNNLTPQGGELNSGGYADESLPEYPLVLIKDSEEQVVKVIYGDIKGLEKVLDEGLEGSFIIWQEELIRNTEGDVIAVETTYPDGIISRIKLIRDSSGSLSEVEITDS